MISRFFTSAVFSIFIGCAPRIAPTLAEITTVFSDFNHCTVHLGWSERLLLAACGDPVKTVNWSKMSGRCHLYPTYRHAFVGERGAPWIAVCVGAPVRIGLGVLPPGDVVKGVFGLSLDAVYLNHPGGEQ